VTILGLPTEISASIDEMDCGTVLLSVPLCEDVIQVGTAKKLPTAQIEVRTSDSEMSVHRTDGKPLQAQIIHCDADGAEWPMTVFAEPVPALRLQRLRTLRGSRLWVVTDGANPRRCADLAQLVQTIVCFGAAKQNCIPSATPAKSA